MDALEAGMKHISGGGQAVTQVWVVVDYTAGGANVKSVNGVAWANVKSVNGVAEASIKSINGITAN